MATMAVMAALHLGVFGTQPEALIAFAVFAFGVMYLWRRLPAVYPHHRFGACNAVTLLRAGLGASLLTPLFASDPVAGNLGAWAVAGVALIVLALDGVDGMLARRSGLTSAFGARFDMEVDAALSLILTLHVLVDGTVGPVVLLLGVMRYLFVAAAMALPWLSAPLPQRFGRKMVCVAQVSALIALQVPVLPSALAQWIAVVAGLALLWSFGRDTLWLWRHRP
ncbi:MAG: CDP-alcohol phosphatidyltransferase family protein [Rhodobacterales bacterium]